jgi:hypothetical protein
LIRQKPRAEVQDRRQLAHERVRQIGAQGVLAAHERLTDAGAAFQIDGLIGHHEQKVACRQVVLDRAGGRRVPAICHDDHHRVARLDLLAMVVVDAHALRLGRPQLKRIQNRREDVHEPLRRFQGLLKACRGRRRPTRDAEALDMDTFFDLT